MSTEVRQWLDFALIQSAAETYIDQVRDLSSIEQIERLLAIGNNIPEKLGLSSDSPTLPGATRFTEQQAKWFTANYDIVTHYKNDSAGFSATIFRNKLTGEYTLSFRSTEYQFESLGGDWARDGKPGADGEIFNRGFAFAQLAAMEDYYAQLKSGTLPTGAVLNVTGYSLGGHLAITLTLLHPDAVVHTHTYNASGLGGFGTAMAA